MSHPAATVTAGNWQHPDVLRWSYCHLDSVLPTAVIRSAADETTTARMAPVGLGVLGDLEVLLPDGTSPTVAEVLLATDTDGWLVLHEGRVVAETYAEGVGPGSRHLLQSVSKSVVGTVAGALAGRGLLDVDTPVSAYVPDLARSGYAGATVRHVLDMRSGIGFVEDYFAPGSDSRRLEAAGGWAEPRPGDPRTIKDHLRSLAQVRRHGGPFEYRSCESDVLGWVCEEAGGAPFAELASELVWRPLGAQVDAVITVDPQGTGMFDGGICATLRDLGRFGAMLLDGGRSRTGAVVLPRWWVDDVFAGGPDSAQAFAEALGDTSAMPGGRYRSQFWSPTAGRELVLGIGIHGQLVHLDRANRVVGVKLSSWPQPEDRWKLAAARAVFDRVATHLGTDH